MALLDPDLTPDVWDTCLIAETIIPGISTISQGGRSLKWDKKTAFGTALPVTKLTGIEASGFELRIDFYDGVNGQTAIAQREDYETQVLPALQRAESGKEAVEFYHPAVSDPPCNITAVVPEQLGIYQQDSDGHWYVVHKLLQFGKPKPAVGAPKGAKKDTKPAALDENEQEIQKLTKQLQDLAKG